MQAQTGVALAVASVAATSPALAYENEVPKPERYQTEAEKERAPRFQIELGLGYGFSATDRMVTAGLLRQGPATQTMLDRLGLTMSETLLMMRVTGRLAFTPDYGVYATLPVGVVQKQPEEDRLPGIVESDDYAVGLGDVSAGGWAHVVQERTFVPDITTTVDVNWNNTQYTSLGDGLIGITPGVHLRKYVLQEPPIYLLASGDWTYRFEQDDVEPGNVWSASGGVGTLAFDGQWRIESRLRYARVGETTVDSMTIPDDDDLTLILSLSSPLAGARVSAFFSGIDDGLGLHPLHPLVAAGPLPVSPGGASDDQILLGRLRRVAADGSARGRARRRPGEAGARARHAQDRGWRPLLGEG